MGSGSGKNSFGSTTLKTHPIVNLLRKLNKKILLELGAQIHELGEAHVCDLHHWSRII
jgi:hypothetical protein